MRQHFRPFPAKESAPLTASFSPPHSLLSPYSDCSSLPHILLPPSQPPHSHLGFHSVSPPSSSRCCTRHSPTSATHHSTSLCLSPSVSSMTKTVLQAGTRRLDDQRAPVPAASRITFVPTQPIGTPAPSQASVAGLAYLGRALLRLALTSPRHLMPLVPQLDSCRPWKLFAVSLLAF